jgi:hypothetical protein
MSFSRKQLEKHVHSFWVWGRKCASSSVRSQLNVRRICQIRPAILLAHNWKYTLYKYNPKWLKQHNQYVSTYCRSLK